MTRWIEVGDGVHGAAVREVTPLPRTLMITHAHGDHFFGTAAFTPCPVWSHPRCAREIATNAEEHRARSRKSVDQPYVIAQRGELAARYVNAGLT